MKRYARVIISVAGALALRLIPFRAPNVEPILSLQMPAAKRFGPLMGFVTGTGSILLYDLVTQTGGRWSWGTALTYGFIGLVAPLYFRQRSNSSWNYVKFAVASTLFFDLVTGVILSPLLGVMPLRVALMGQIPFTALHLFGNVALAATVSPLLYRWFAAPVAQEAPVGVRKTPPVHGGA